MAGDWVSIALLAGSTQQAPFQFPGNGPRPAETVMQSTQCPLKEENYRTLLALGAGNNTLKLNGFYPIMSLISDTLNRAGYGGISGPAAVAG